MELSLQVYDRFGGFLLSTLRGNVIYFKRKVIFKMKQSMIQCIKKSCIVAAGGWLLRKYHHTAEM